MSKNEAQTVSEHIERTEKAQKTLQLLTLTLDLYAAQCAATSAFNCLSEDQKTMEINRLKNLGKSLDEVLDEEELLQYEKQASKLLEDFFIECKSI